MNEDLLQVSVLAKQRFGLNPSDLNEPDIRMALFHDGMTPEEYVDWIEQQYKLQRIDDMITLVNKIRNT